jgi:hypothetical protein
MLYRLANVPYSIGPAYTYTLDAVGIRLTQETPVSTNNYEYDIANRLIEVDGTS